MISLSELSSKLKKERKVALICHVRPDGDTLGSALALSLALNNLGIEAEVVCDDPVPSRFFFLKEAQTIKNQLNGQFDALIAIDCADVMRLGSFADVFVRHKNTYSIDHHVSNTRYAKTNYVFDSSSNCENILALIDCFGVFIDKSIADLLMMGIMTDTGSFHHKNVTAETLSAASRLKRAGADVNAIHYHMFTKQSPARAKLFGYTMSNIRYFHQNRLAVATVRLSDFERAGAKQDETEGFIDFIMTIDGVEIGACVMEVSKDKYKISLRSKSADVSAVASTFGGGGHTLASGCQIMGDYEEVIDKISFAVSRYLPD